MAGYPNITVSLAEGTGKFKSDESTLSTYFSITDSKVAKIEIVCNDIDVDQIVNLISIKGGRQPVMDYLFQITKGYPCRNRTETEE